MRKEKKPAQYGKKYASIFQDASVVKAYRHRPLYPPATFHFLSGLIPAGAGERVVLDAGCGTGYIARPLAALVDHVDAVDISPAMIAMGQTEPGGDRPNITWQNAPIETAALRPAYGLIVTAASLQWMDWDVALPRFARHMAPGGALAVVEEVHQPNPWDAALTPIFRRYSMNQDFAPFDVLAELERRRLFRKQGSYETPPMPTQQPVEDWVESFHARNGFSRDRMDRSEAQAFDHALRAAVTPYCPGGLVDERIYARVVWGRPLAGE